MKKFLDSLLVLVDQTWMWGMNGNIFSISFVKWMIFIYTLRSTPALFACLFEYNDVADLKIELSIHLSDGNYSLSNSNLILTLCKVRANQNPISSKTIVTTWWADVFSENHEVVIVFVWVCVSYWTATF